MDFKDFDLKPGQLLRYCGTEWEIDGEHLGGAEHADLIELRNITDFSGSAHGKTVEAMYIPRKLLVAAIAGGAELYERIN